MDCQSNEYSKICVRFCPVRFLSHSRGNGRRSIIHVYTVVYGANQSYNFLIVFSAKLDSSMEIFGRTGFFSDSYKTGFFFVGEMGFGELGIRRIFSVKNVVLLRGVLPLFFSYLTWWL